MSKHVMAKARAYKLFRGADGFDLDTKKLLDENLVLVPRKHIEKINKQYKQCGKYYVIDEDATNEAFEQGEANVKANREAEEDQAELGNVLAASLKAAKNVKVKSSDELTKARAELKALTGIKTYHGWDLETVLSKIEESNNN